MDYVVVDDYDYVGVFDDKLLGNIVELLFVIKENLRKVLCSRVIVVGG